MSESEFAESVGRGDGADEAGLLIKGNRSFVEARTRDDPEVFQRLARGQKPPFLLAGCCDSRKPLDILTGAGPGQLFILRNVANQLPAGDAATDAALEFALLKLHVRHIIVSGHTRCGGVDAALRGVDQGAVGRWIAPLRELARVHRDELDAIEDPDARVDRLAEINVIVQVENALRHPAVRARLDGEGPPLHLHGWMFRVETGLLEALPLPVERWTEAGLLAAG
jgi:carbonic anhydrase